MNANITKCNPLGEWLRCDCGSGVQLYFFSMRIPQNLGDHIIQGQVFVSKRTVNNYVGLIAETGTIWGQSEIYSHST